ncbi:MAG: hypothetical protein ACI840_000697 [Ulvibacter sp.]|jgi:hypothetical protein
MRKTLITLCLFVFVNNLLIAQFTQIGSEINGAENNFQAGASLSFNNTGDVLAIGYLRTTPFGYNRGMGRVFEFQNGEWIQKGSDIGNQYLDNKGFHVNINGTGTILAMSPGVNAGFEDPFVSIYEFVNNDWQLMGNLIEIYNGIAKLNDLGNTVIILNSMHNELRVYEFLNNDWQLKGDPLISSGPYLGQSIDINDIGDIIATVDFDPVSHANINIYNYENNQWNQIGDISFEPYYILRVNFDLNKQGDAFVASALKEDVNDVLYLETKVYNYTNQVWTQVGNDIINNPTEDPVYIDSQAAISADGNIIAIGNTIESGSVMIYKLINNQWVQFDDGVTGDGGEFGRALSFNDDASLLSIGAPTYSEVGNYFGQVKTFEIDYELLNIEDNSIANTIFTYPNPAHDYITLNSQNDISINTIKIYDALGRLVLMKNNPQNLINISTLTNGLLIVKIETDKGIKVEKVIKQ